MHLKCGNKAMTATAFASKNGPLIFTLGLTLPPLLAIGTGGLPTTDYYRLREANLVFELCDAPAEAKNDVCVASPLDMMLSAQSILKLTTSDLSEWIDVSRQTIYLWKAGGNISVANAARIHEIEAASDVLRASKIPISPFVMNRSISGGKSLRDLIKAGIGGAQAASMLVSIIQEEDAQRKILDSHFAERKTRPDRSHLPGARDLSEGV